MLAEDVLRREPIVLTQDQRQFYFDHGYLHLDGFISEDWMARLWSVTDRFIDSSRAVAQSDSTFDLEPTHSAGDPRLRRLNQPAEQDPIYREFALNGPIVDLAEDLLGPDVKYHHSKLNFKWASGGEEVKWHQDIQYWPHTNYSPLTIGVYMNDVTDEMGPMGIVPGSHKGELFDLFDDDGNWTGAIKQRELGRVDLTGVDWLKGRRGSVTVHNCRCVHGSEPNRSTTTRPLLLHTYAAADALPICASIADGWPLANTIVRGQPARWMRFDPRPCLIPPDWSGGYSSIFALQQADAAE